MYITQRSNIKKKTIINNRCPLLSSAVANSAVSPHQRQTRDVVSASLFYFFVIILTIFYNYIFIINSFNSFNNNDGGLKYLSNTRYRFVCRSIKQYKQLCSECSLFLMNYYNFFKNYLEISYGITMQGEPMQIRRISHL